MKRIFTFNKVALLGIVLFFNNSIVMAEGKGYVYKAIAGCCSTNTGTGTISAQITITPDCDVQGELVSSKTYCESVGYGGVVTFGMTSSVVRFTEASFKATEDAGSIFIGWYTNEEGSVEHKKSAKEFTEDSDLKATKSKTYGPYYAKFDAIILTPPTEIPEIAIIGFPIGEQTQTLTFKTNATDGYCQPTCKIVNNGANNGNFQVVSTTGIADSLTTVTYKYVPNGNVHVQNPKDDHAKLTITLSKGDWTTSASVDLHATVDLTPVFSIDDKCDYNTKLGDIFTNTPVSYTLSPTDMNDVAQAANCVWCAKLSTSTEGFSISNTKGTVDSEGFYPLTGANAQVQFLSADENQHTATLSLKCVYYDDKSNLVSSAVSQTTLTAMAQAPTTAEIIFGNRETEYSFGTVVCGVTTPHEISLNAPNTENISLTPADEDGAFTWFYDAEAHILTVAVRQDMAPSDYTATITATGTDSRDHTTQVSATFSLSASIRLATPQLQAFGGHSQVTLLWQRIGCATGYTIKQGSTEVATISTSDIMLDEQGNAIYVRTGLTNGTAYSYTVTAVYASNTSYNQESNTASATPGVITMDNVSYLGIETGTEHPTKNTFPWKKKTAIDVSAAFAGGVAQFNTLYIFGLTTNTDNSTTTLNGVTFHDIKAANKDAGSNAKTPCYIYVKDGNNYKYSETIENMNVADKPSQFVEIKANSQKLYFTGYCPYASCGYTSDMEGVLYITGGKSATIDLYFDNFNLYTRYKTRNGNEERPVTYDPMEKVNLVGAISMYVQGSGAALVFQSSSTTGGDAAFRPTIHVRGANSMEGTEGAYINMKILSKEAGQYSSPLQIRSTKEKQCTTLTIDDEWQRKDGQGTEHTNGIYKLSKRVNSAPSIDLGNANTTLVFNGGQIFLQNSTPASGEYTTVFAISCRAYSKSLGSITATLYGLGNDRGDGTVLFNDGSINCTPISEDAFKQYGKYYRDRFSMKCPKNTKIDGGTYSCEIYACEGVSSLGVYPTNQKGDQVASYPLKATGTKEYGLAEFTSPTYLVHKTSGLSITDYYKQLGKDYGRNSLAANDTGYVNLMLPCDFIGKDPLADITMIPWALCSPSITAGSKNIGETVYMGGAETVVSDDTHRTQNLVWVSMDENMKAALSGYKTPEMNDITVSMDSKEPYSQEIRNTDDYVIQSEIYLMKPVVADRWMTFVAPFDVSEIYVLESYPENVLETLAKEDNKEAALKKQAVGSMDFMFYLCYFVDWNENSTYDFNQIYNTWVNYEKKESENKDDYQLPNTFGRKKLEHFTGKNWDANYFLYQSSGEWQLDGENLKTDWSVVTPISKTYNNVNRDVLMERGKFYSMQFPYKLGENDGGWDYWGGKYIILKGYGPQDIYGTSRFNEFLTTSSAAVALRGNATLANMSVVSQSNVMTLANNYFISTNEETTELKPADGFLLTNTQQLSAPQGMRVKSIGLRSGSITYEPDTNTPTGVPTIAGNATLMVQQADGGMEVIPLQPQHVEILSTDGRLVYSGTFSEQTYFPVPAGLYLIRGEHEVLKVIVR